jgi:tRNA-dihydrouridine synthase
MLAETGVDGVSVARGAIGNPWIFQQARALLAGERKPALPSVTEQAAVLAEHYRLAVEIYGDRCGPQMRKFGIKYASLHPAGEQVREAFIGVTSLADWTAVLDRWYQGL